MRRDDGRRPRRTRLCLLSALLALFFAGCRQDMHDQPRYEPLETSDFFADGQSSRPRVAGTVARGWPIERTAVETGLGADGRLVSEFPVPVDAGLVARGRERYDIFCSPCHARTGDGNGMIVQRGFKRPESFHSQRLRDIPVGYFFDVITNGFGQMSSYRTLVPVADRWAIAAYVRALQLSRVAPAARLTAADRERLDRPEAATGETPGAKEEGEGQH